MPAPFLKCGAPPHSNTPSSYSRTPDTDSSARDPRFPQLRPSPLHRPGQLLLKCVPATGCVLLLRWAQGALCPRCPFCLETPAPVCLVYIPIDPSEESRLYLPSLARLHVNRLRLSSETSCALGPTRASALSTGERVCSVPLWTLHARTARETGPVSATAGPPGPATAARRSAPRRRPGVCRGGRGRAGSATRAFLL